MTPQTGLESDHGPDAGDLPGNEPAAAIRRNLTAVRDEIAAACRRAGRPQTDVTLLPVTKYARPEYAALLLDAGLRALGESTVQETQRKAAALGPGCGVRWHLIGHLQRNKVGRALELYEVIHSLDSLRLARAIEQRLEAGGDGDARRCPRLLVEVNVAGEVSKGGVPFDEALELLARVHSETGLGYSLGGLMTLAPLEHDPERTRGCFRRLRELRDRAVEAGLLPAGAELSMGMSQDFPVAIEEGATIVRVGTRLFDGLPMRNKT